MRLSCTAAQDTLACADVASCPRQDTRRALGSGLAWGSLPSLSGLSEPGRATRNLGTAAVLPVCNPPEPGASTKAPAAAGRVEGCPCHTRPDAPASAGSQASPLGQQRPSWQDVICWEPETLGPPSLIPAHPSRLFPPPGAVFCLGTLAQAVPFAWNVFPALSARKRFLPPPTPDAGGSGDVLLSSPITPCSPLQL